MSEGRLLPGRRIDDRFELEERLGAGAFGVVWRAKDLSNESQVAIKILHGDLTSITEGLEQLSREASVLSQLDHPNLAKPLACRMDGPRAYMAMELAAGAPLSEVIAQQGSLNRYFENSTLIDILSQICAAVSHAHSRLIVHRDIKPQNVMVDRTEEGPSVKVVDFGIARLMAGNLFDATTFGRRIGSVFYMAPEQVRGEPAEVTTDVFALGSIFFEMMTLRRAWAREPDGTPAAAFVRPVPRGSANSLDSVVERILRGPRPEVSAVRPDLPRAFDDLIARSLAVEPGDRPPQVDDFLREALGLLTGESEAQTSIGLPFADSQTIQLARPSFFEVGPTLVPPDGPNIGSTGRTGEDTVDEIEVLPAEPYDPASSDRAPRTRVFPVKSADPTAPPVQVSMPPPGRHETTRAQSAPPPLSLALILLIMGSALVLGMLLMMVVKR